MTIASEAFFNRKVLPQILVNVICRTTSFWTPLLLIFYDERLSFSYYKNFKQKKHAAANENLEMICKNTNQFGQIVTETPN